MPSTLGNISRMYTPSAALSWLYQSEPLIDPFVMKMPLPGEPETVRFWSDGPPLLLLLL